MDYLIDVGYVDPCDHDELDELRADAADERRDLEREAAYDRAERGGLLIDSVYPSPVENLVEALAASLSHLSPCADCPDPALCAAERDCPRGEASC